MTAIGKAQAAGPAPTNAEITAQASVCPPVKQSAALEFVTPTKNTGAKVVTEMPGVRKQVRASKTVAPKLAKKNDPIVDRAVTKTRCFAQRPVTRTQSSSAGIPVSSPAPQFPPMTGLAFLAHLEASKGLLSRCWRWIRSRQVARSSARRLHVAATASLGEKRFVAVIQIDDLQFLVGGGATNVVLLAQLDARKSFGDVLNEKETKCDDQSKLDQAEARA